MLLRLVMVGAVASLGFDLPTGKDVQAWTQAGQTWWDATTAQWVLPLLENFPDAYVESEEQNDVAAPEPESIAETVPAAADEPAATETEALADQAFQGVVTEIVSSFTTETTPAPSVAVRETPSFEPVEVGDDLYPGLAYELNRASEGAPVPVSQVAQSALPPTSGQTEVHTASTSELLADAVRLTNQAVGAWVSLLRHDVTIVSVRE